MRAGTVLSNGSTVSQGQRAYHLLPSGAYLVTTTTGNAGLNGLAVLRVNSDGTVTVVLDCATAPTGADAAVRQEICALSFPFESSSPPRHDDEGHVILFGEEPWNPLDRRIYHVNPEGLVRRILDVGASDEIEGMPANLAFRGVMANLVTLDGMGWLYATLEFTDGVYSNYTALIKENLVTGQRIVLSANGAGVPGVPAADHVANIRLFGEAGAGGGLVAATVSGTDTCGTNCVYASMLQRVDAGGAFTLLAADFKGPPIYSSGRSPYVAGLVDGEERTVFSASGSVIHLHVHEGQGVPGRGAGTIGRFALPRVSAGGEFVAVDYELVGGGNAVTRFAADGGVDSLIVSGDVLNLAGEMRTVRSVGLMTAVPYVGFRSDRFGLGPIEDGGGLAVHVRLDGGALGNNVPAILVVGVPPDPIVNSTGDAVQGAGSAACDTGAIVASGEPECTLRAAIELANRRGRAARIGFDLPNASVISPGSALPVIGVDLEIQVDAGFTIVVDGASAGAADGLLAVDARLQVDGLTIRSFGGDCVQAVSAAGLRLRGVTLEACGGIGAFNADGPVDVGALGLRRSVVRGNGGGGVVARGEGGTAPLVQVRDATVEENGTVGIASSEDVRVSNVIVRDNHGPGVVGDVAPSSARPAVHFEAGGESLVTGNQGVGVAGFSAVVAAQPVEITDNGSWGVAAGRLVIGDAQRPVARRSLLKNNGRGTTCHGVEPGVDGRPQVVPVDCQAGGAWLFAPFASGASLFFDVDIVENGGPGVFSTTRVDLGRFSIRDNEGEGLVVDNLDGGVVEPTILIFNLAGSGRSEVSGNRGTGLESRFGAVAISSPIVIADNGGWGIFGHDRVGIGDSMNPPPAPSEIARNGVGTGCRKWWAPDRSSLPRPQAVPCRGGGVAALSPSATVRTRLFHLTIAENAGPGIFTGHAFELGHVQITGNNGPGASLGDEHSFVGPDDWAAVLGHGTRITSNAGEGVYLARGTVNVPYGSDLRIEGNAGAGILVVAGDVLLADSNAAPSGERISIRGNGAGGRCRTFEVPANVLDVVEAGFPCGTAGIHSENDVRGTDTDIIGNGGDGLLAGRRAVLRSSRVCKNGGQQIVSKEQVLFEVDLVCDDLPDPDPSPDPDGGGCQCRAAGARASSGTHPGPLLLLLAALALLRGRRRVVSPRNQDTAAGGK